MADTAIREKVSRAVWICYAAGVFAYVAAVFGRTSFGVAAIPAAGRFDASASDIASFTVVQLLTYAGLQIPVGVMIDRFGPRRLVIIGAFLMAIGQAYLALATSVTPALIARVLIGAGDALTFTCVLRKVADTFPSRRVPMMTQLTGLLGQLGQLMSAIPFAALLAVQSWTFSFLTVAATSLLAGILAIAFFRGGDETDLRSVQNLTPSNIGKQLSSAWRHPGTKLGFWTHFTMPFSVSVFALLWGYPFMTSGLGFSQHTASLMLTLNVFVALVASAPMGRFVSRHPLRRSTLMLTLVALIVGWWSVVLLWPGRVPVWVIAVLMMVISLGGPGSMVGFDFARTFNPSSRLGSASGIVNVGGFVAALVTMFAMGVILDWAGPHDGGYDLASFKWAFMFQYLVWGLGVWMMIRSRNRTRRILAREEGVVVPPLRSAISRDWRRFKQQHRRHDENRHDDESSAEPRRDEPAKPEADWQI